jgi:hypothetical protein
MSHWNYRVMVKDGQFGVHEVFYTDDGVITGYTAQPVFPRAESAEELAKELGRYQRALGEPVLDFAALETAANHRLSTRPG